MSIQIPGAGAPDYAPCKYPGSRLAFRGPERNLDNPYIACLGGTKTFGRFVTAPFPDMLEQRLGRVCVNFGCVNSGIDTLLAEPAVLEMARKADVSVLQVLGAQNISNRYYRVHPRRNDRFLAASPLLQKIYGEADFTEFSFNRHMLMHLHKVDPDRFSPIAAELRAVWQARMQLVLDAIGPNVVLLWIRMDQDAPPLGPEPGLIQPEMLDPFRDRVRAVVEVTTPPALRMNDLATMRFGPLDEPAAANSLGPLAHARIAEKLHTVIEPMVT